METRPESESFEPLIGFLAFVIQKLWSGNNKERYASVMNCARAEAHICTKEHHFLQLEGFQDKRSNAHLLRSNGHSLKPNF